MKNNGRETVARHVSRSEPLSRADVVHRLAQEARAEINSIDANLTRMGKQHLAVRRSRLDGIKQSLMIALGLPLGSWDEVEAFLEEFKQERLGGTQSA